MEELMRNQTPIDLITLDQALKAKGISDSVAGLLISQIFLITPQCY